jgi:trimethylamine--corrinoid protein Co-methyltransferase
MGVPSDVPVPIADRYQFYHAVANNAKTMYSSAYTPEGMADAVEMATLIAGGRQALRQRPFFTTGINPSTPLRYGREVIGKLFVMAEAGLPMIFNSCPMAGATAPVTLASTMVVALAEGLAALTLAQLVCPGVPVIPGGGPTIMDMSTTVCAQGAPELCLLVAACAQMYRHYKIPSYGTAGGTNSKVVDPQAAIEATNSILSAALAGSNLVHCIGAIEDCMTVSLEAFVLGDEIIAMVRSIAGGMMVSQETLALDLLKKVGPGGHFIDQEHTLHHFREHHYSKMIDRRMYDAWVLRSAKTMNDRMTEKVHWILENHDPEPLPDDILRELDRLLARAEARMTTTTLQ